MSVGYALGISPVRERYVISVAVNALKKARTVSEALRIIANSELTFTEKLFAAYIVGGLVYAYAREEVELGGVAN